MKVEVVACVPLPPIVEFERLGAFVVCFFCGKRG
jgi:hypothetical protein